MAWIIKDNLPGDEEPAPEPKERRTALPKDASYDMSFSTDAEGYGEREVERRRVEEAQKRGLYDCRDEQREQRWKLEESNRKQMNAMRAEERKRDMEEVAALETGISGVLNSKSPRSQAAGNEDYAQRLDLEKAREKAQRHRELKLLESEMEASYARVINAASNRRGTDAVFKEQSRREMVAERLTRFSDQAEEDEKEAELLKIHAMASKQFIQQTRQDLESFEEKRAKTEMYRKMGVSSERKPSALSVHPVLG